jgi:pheromone shutdown protein TraB
VELRSQISVVLERLVRRYLGNMVAQLALGVVLVALVPVVAVLGFAVFAVFAILLFGLYALLGQPDALAPFVGIGWFFGSLIAIFVILVRGHRWLSRVLALADAPARAIDPDVEEPIVAAVEYPSLTLQERLAAADAHLAPDHSADPPRPTVGQ